MKYERQKERFSTLLFIIHHSSFLLAGLTLRTFPTKVTVLTMPVEQWSDRVIVAHMADDPQFTEDLLSIEQEMGSTPRDAVLDMAAVHFLNSSNLAKLLKLRKNIAGNERRLILCGISNPVWSAFLVTGLDKIFEFSANVPTALATLQLT
jgi:anti-anti-sigma factor